MESEKGFVQLENRKILKLTGIREVMSFQESQAEFASTLGILQVTGENMHMEKLDLETGEVVLSGRIDSLYYPEDTPKGKKGFLSRLLP